MNDPELRPLNISALTVDPRVQRALDVRRVRKIADSLNWDAIGVITVSARENGDYAVIDGQHRTAALREAGHGENVMCRVFTGLTIAEEAEMFRLLNNTAKPQYIDLFRVRVIEGDPAAVDMARMLKRHGWKVTIGTQTGVFAAVAAFERIYNLDDVAAERTIATITRAWGRDAGNADGRLVEGIGLVYVRYGDAVDTDDLINRLARFAGGANALIGKARGLRDLVGSTVPRAVAEIVVEEYNRRRKTKALPPWRTA